jgi:transcriptional regulator
MHPHPGYAWTDGGEMLAFLSRVSFSTIFVCGEAGPMLVHAPVVVGGTASLRFHVSRANRAAASLEGAQALLSCVGPDAYVSPDWYGTPDQVPTWNYVAVECEGPLRQLDREGLRQLLDDLGAAEEARLAPKPVWTRAKMTPGKFEAMLSAIVGFEMRIEAIRGTRKLGQMKTVDERRGAAAGVAGAGNASMAALMMPDA